MDSLELIINLSIIILLIPTIIYAYKLNKNLSLLRQNQKSLSQLISSPVSYTHLRAHET